MARSKVIVGEPTWALKDPVLGAKVYRCSLCGTDMWLGPTCQSMISDGDSLQCRPCAIKDITEEAEVIIAPGVLAELRRHLGRHVTEREARRYVERIMRRQD